MAGAAPNQEMYGFGVWQGGKGNLGAITLGNLDLLYSAFVVIIEKTWG